MLQSMRLQRTGHFEQLNGDNYNVLFTDDKLMHREVKYIARVTQPEITEIRIKSRQ